MVDNLKQQQSSKLWPDMLRNTAAVITTFTDILK